MSLEFIEICKIIQTCQQEHMVFICEFVSVILNFQKQLQETKPILSNLLRVRPTSSGLISLSVKHFRGAAAHIPLYFIIFL